MFSVDLPERALTSCSCMSIGPPRLHKLSPAITSGLRRLRVLASDRATVTQDRINFDGEALLGSGCRCGLTPLAGSSWRPSDRNSRPGAPAAGRFPIVLWTAARSMLNMTASTSASPFFVPTMGVTASRIFYFASGATEGHGRSLSLHRTGTRRAPQPSSISCSVKVQFRQSSNNVRTSECQRWGD
jgi:hypothetical protein